MNNLPPALNFNDVDISHTTRDKVQALEVMHHHVDQQKNSLKEQAELLEKQIQNLMFASANEFYVYKIIDSPVVPELKSKPNRALFCIVGTLLGGILSVIIALIMFYVKKES